MEPDSPNCGYELQSPLARLSVHAAERNPRQALDWVNSICLLFLVIGVAGSRPAALHLKPLPKLEEASAVIVEPLRPPPTAVAEQPSEEQNEQQQSDAPGVVVVTPDAPSINFSVPTIGNVLVPEAIAQAPPPAPLKPVAPLPRPPSQLTTTGSSGDRPQPPYPRLALEQGQQGSVTLHLTVDGAGLVQAIEVVQSSGFPLLDHSARDFVRRHWVVPPGNGARTYEAAITYKLQLN